MATYADRADVEAIYEGTAPSRTTALLDRLERRLLELVPDVATRVAIDPEDDEAGEYLDPLAVKDVLVDACCRQLRNPKGYQSERDGDYSYSLASGRSEGTWFTREELARLRLPTTSSVGAFYAVPPTVMTETDERWPALGDGLTWSGKKLAGFSRAGDLGT